jgi:hypothetical protein
MPTSFVMAFYPCGSASNDLIPPEPCHRGSAAARSLARADEYPDCHGNGSAKVPFAMWIELTRGEHMNGIIYLVGLVVVILAILSFLGLR